MPPPPELPTGGLPKNVESIIIGEGVVKAVSGCIVLPNGTILVTDEEEGLILFDTQGNVLRKVKHCFLSLNSGKTSKLDVSEQAFLYRVYVLILRPSLFNCSLLLRYGPKKPRGNA
ncbi:hypothetical protein OESDEN_09739 [Oesophagostomum dentatum]|uniref:Uncharacterized protein n=1 Tax=Oesophagostomum dentatum TaxID=61180 RepID=A0A0B1T3P0_OESDE|nr:hypothetical protein OESDEN_09739 [Oesophagostomum dentatum]